MKRFLAFALAAAMLFALCACGSLDINQGDGGNDKENYVKPDEDGFAEGRLGDVMHTKWFDFTINSAYTADVYESYVPAEGNMMLIVDCTVKNTFNRSTPMADIDFQAQWGDDDDYAYATPITDDGTEEGLPVINDEQLPSLYELAVSEERTGKLVYEVPAGHKDFSVSFLEYDEEGTEGDLFFVYFTADAAVTA